MNHEKPNITMQPEANIEPVSEETEEAERQENIKWEAEFAARQARMIQEEFGERIDSLGSEKMTREEFEKWEDRYRKKYEKIQTKTSMITHSINEECEIAKGAVAYADDGKLYKTIEAQAGNYFFERQTALSDAIKKSGKTEAEKEEELRQIENFVAAAHEHIQLKYMAREDILKVGVEQYEQTRVSVHNKTLKMLNYLNNMCNLYEITPFTARNFLPSDIVDKNHQTLAEQTIMHYDRHIVEKYYAIAFPDAARKAEYRFRRENGLL